MSQRSLLATFMLVVATCLFLAKTLQLQRVPLMTQAPSIEVPISAADFKARYMDASKFDHWDKEALLSVAVARLRTDLRASQEHHLKLRGSSQTAYFQHSPSRDGFESVPKEHLTAFWTTAAQRAAPGFRVMVTTYDTASQYVLLTLVADRR
jgi:hypothetical protein